LYDYVRYVSQVNENKILGMQVNEAVNRAVDWAIRKNLLDGYFKQQKEEILANSLTEFDAEEAYRDIRNDGYEEGLAEGREAGRVEGASQKAIEAARNALKMNLSMEQVAQITNLSLEEIRELTKNTVKV
jgi:predicted transposase/invertase (TIGR01784 family)